jgi:mRNA-degrading endonuclease toxin of MazEF toxin-antitoxin module
LAIGVVIRRVRKAPLRVVTSAVNRSINPITGPVQARRDSPFAPRRASGTALEVARAAKARSNGC